MPRNASGNYTLPLPAVVTGTVIESLWANTTMNDLASSVTDSLDRYGRGGMVAPFRMVDGTVSIPAISFTGETNTGIYRPSAGVISVSVLGSEKQTWTSTGTTVGGDFNLIGDFNVLGQMEMDGDLILADSRALAWGTVNTRIAGNDTTDVIAAFTQGVERWRLNGAGGFGVGTDDPQVRLHVKHTGELFRLETTTPRGSGSNYLSFYDPSGRKGFFGYGGASDIWYFNNELAGSISFWTSNQPRMDIAATGQIGVNGVSTVGMFDVSTSGAGIISKSASEAGSVAHLGVYNLNVNGLQWYIAMNANNTDIHNPRGNLRHWLGGIQKFDITPSAVNSYVPLGSVGGSHQVVLFGQAAPLVQWFYAGIADWRIQILSDGSMRWDFGGAPTYRMTLNASGALMVGTNHVSPGYQNINGQSLEGASGYGVLNHVSGSPGGLLFFAFGYGGGNIGSIIQNGTTQVAYSTTSDLRLKTNIVNLPDAGVVIDALRPVEFEFKTDLGRRLRGLIAQEAVELLPEAVVYNALDDQWCIDYGMLTPLLLREIQSLRARVAALEV